MIEEPKRRAESLRQDVLIEPTSATPASAWLLSRGEGLPADPHMPETMSLERACCCWPLARTVLTLAGRMRRIAKAKEFWPRPRRYICTVRQPRQPAVHYATTGPRSGRHRRKPTFSSLRGHRRTITGIARYIKERKPGFKAMPWSHDSPVLSAASRPHRSRASGRLCARVLDTALIDEIVQVSTTTHCHGPPAP